MSKPGRVVCWILQIALAVLLAQTLYFKFGGEEISVWIFSQLGVEPWGRYATATAEGITALLLVIPATAAVGAVLALGVLGGAIMSHVAILGIQLVDESGTQLDDGSLFAMAVGMAIAAAVVLWLRRGELPVIGPKLAKDPDPGASSAG